MVCLLDQFIALHFVYRVESLEVKKQRTLCCFSELSLCWASECINTGRVLGNTVMIVLSVLPVFSPRCTFISLV
jgi:hypothetical protein